MAPRTREEFSFNTVVRAFTIVAEYGCYYMYILDREREYGNTENRFVAAIKEHSDIADTCTYVWASTAPFRSIYTQTSHQLNL